MNTSNLSRLGQYDEQAAAGQAQLVGIAVVPQEAARRALADARPVLQA